MSSVSSELICRSSLLEVKHIYVFYFFLSVLDLLKSTRRIKIAFFIIIVAVVVDVVIMVVATVLSARCNIYISRL